jgi:hypothetical protein
MDRFRSLLRRMRVVPGTVLMLAAFAALPVAVAAAAPLEGATSPAPTAARSSTAAPAVLVQWGTKGAGNGQFDEPSGLAVGTLGEVYVADDKNCRVQVFREDGSYVGQWGRSGDKDGEFGYMTRLTVGPTGDVFVLDPGHGRVEVFTSSGSFLRKWGSLGVGEGQFDGPWGVAVDLSGNVYVADRYNHRVQKFTSGGAFLKQWGGDGSGPSQFKDVNAVTVSPAGHVFTVDAGNSRITEFSADGDVLNQWGSLGHEPGQFAGPFAVAVDKQGRIYVMDGNNNRIQVFRPDGSFLTQWKVLSTARVYDIAVDASGDVYIVDNYHDWVRRYAAITAGQDTKPPKTTVNGLDNKWHNSPVTLTYTATDDADGSGVAYTESHMQEWLSPLWSAWVRGSTYLVPASADHSDDGDRSVEFRSADLAGNVEKKRKVVVRIDTTPPRVRVFPATVTSGRKGKVTFRVTDQLSPEVRVQLQVENANGDSLYQTTSTWLKRQAKNSWTFTCRLRPGVYDLLVAAEDVAGNLGSAGQAKLTVK